MYLIRPAEPADRAAVEALVRARSAWMRDHGLGRWRGWEHSARALADQIAEPDWPVWVLVDPAGDLIGVTTTDETPHLGWTEHERAEPAIFLQSTVTHPDHAGQSLGMVIAFWALDRAARLGQRWVRRGVLTDQHGGNLGLIAYYRRQGWRVVRTIPHPRKPQITVWSLARPAARQPDLDRVVAEN
ncbi:hypothetical protein EV193_104527 [Herbihabitans rhizosphaerae]|uniref:N-acetyltransferase domain-containing protein n=1 Tax=Herbihabitans rhizosphaerae TaxID=1872711 RepID=A0A4Q7KT39_9PSEU|nr:hypothetical protein [Herbihabitans rhizosphaerae]RZS39310.1 hypothetical protein EV193_104527 [Herbihabitans rhizosphaerae]